MTGSSTSFGDMLLATLRQNADALDPRNATRGVGFAKLDAALTESVRRHQEAETAANVAFLNDFRPEPVTPFSDGDAT